MTNYNLSVPDQLRKKYVSAEISRQIFFIDCINDLVFCSKQNNAYHLIRASVSLRILLLDGGLETILGEKQQDITFMANQAVIVGRALSKKDIRNINNLKSIFSEKHRYTNYISLIQQPLKSYTLSDFIEKICLEIRSGEVYNFSVQNIIEIVANKHGGAHLEAGFNTVTMESLMMGNFSPFTMKDDNFFLLKIKEILNIFTVAMIPICLKIIKNLERYNVNNFQAESSSFAYVVTFEDLQKSKSDVIE